MIYSKTIKLKTYSCLYPYEIIYLRDNVTKRNELEGLILKIKLYNFKYCINLEVDITPTNGEQIYVKAN